MAATSWETTSGKLVTRCCKKRRLYVPIRNADDWWNLCEKRWTNILDIFAKVGAPMGRSEEDHWWSDKVGTPSTHHDECLAQTLEDLKTARNHDALLRLFHQAWTAAPDDVLIHSWNGWFDLCDLCSEEWVFYEAANDA